MSLVTKTIDSRILGKEMNLDNSSCLKIMKKMKMIVMKRMMIPMDGELSSQITKSLMSIICYHEVKTQV